MVTAYKTRKYVPAKNDPYGSHFQPTFLVHYLSGSVFVGCSGRSPPSLSLVSMFYVMMKLKTMEREGTDRALRPILTV